MNKDQPKFRNYFIVEGGVLDKSVYEPDRRKAVSCSATQELRELHSYDHHPDSDVSSRCKKIPTSDVQTLYQTGQPREEKLGY